MSKWYGMIGYGITSEEVPGKWELQVIERPYYGDITRTVMSAQQGEGLNDNIVLKNDVSIIADPYALQNFASMRYITIMGARWRIRSVEVQRPRLLISLGGVYNGPTPDASGETGEDSGGQESILSTPS